ncbi:MAG: M56 family metallopeptidase [Lawsonibacter sp.]|nr:M56 family metallopeptidase [Lawsonibacter sp.]
MTDIWAFLLQTLTASGAAVMVLVVKAMLRDKLSPRWQFAAWGVLAVILLLPAGRGGRYALLNWPFYVELFRSGLTGEYGALARVTAPVPLPAAAVPRTAEEWLFAIYCVGVLFLLVRYIVSYIRLRLLLKRGRENGQVRGVAEEYGLKACPAVEVEGLPSAFVCGVLRPVLALPARRATDEKVILHELLHLKYRDAAWGLVICFFRCLHWCNPLLWYCADRAGNDLESLCDQRVLERLEGEDRRDYGRILLEMADERYARAPGTSSMANGGKNIRRRIEAIARFKKYPAGMGLVSVCVLLVLAVPLIVGARAETPSLGAVNVPVQMARARTTPCTTYAGAIDTYAKAVMTWRRDYRAMCAPMSEQNRLAAEQQFWRAGGPESILNNVENSSGYQFRNLTRIDENTYEGLLVLKLNNPPGRPRTGSDYIWLAVQRLRAEKEGARWVVIPQEDFWATEAYGWKDWPSSCDELPALEYEARSEDFLLRLRRQTSSTVDSYEQEGNHLFGIWQVFSTEPRPNGSFNTYYYQHLEAEYTGSPEDKRNYTSLGASSRPIWGEDRRPELEPLSPPEDHPDATDWTGGSNQGDAWSSATLRVNWESPVFLGGGGSSVGEDPFAHPSAYAVDFYVNGEKSAELTLHPVKGGAGLD